VPALIAAAVVSSPVVGETPGSGWPFRAALKVATVCLLTSGASVGAGSAIVGSPTRADPTQRFPSSVSSKLCALLLELLSSDSRKIILRRSRPRDLSISPAAKMASVMSTLQFVGVQLTGPVLPDDETPVVPETAVAVAVVVVALPPAPPAAVAPVPPVSRTTLPPQATTAEASGLRPPNDLALTRGVPCRAKRGWAPRRVQRVVGQRCRRRRDSTCTPTSILDAIGRSF